MEDYITFKAEPTKDRHFRQTGGKEAAKYAKENLWTTIKDTDGFESEHSDKVSRAISQGFLKTHEDMWKVRGKHAPYKSC